jgi:triosephosphate isomerase (TIM)
MHKTPDQARDFFTQLKLKSVNAEMVFLPSSTSLETTAAQLAGSTKIFWGAQNCHQQKQGAFTGEISAETLAQMGARFVLLGHSERRQFFAETSELVALKAAAVHAQGLVPMICIGETLTERQQGQTFQILEKMLIDSLKDVNCKRPLVIAYEPVLAIGTGQVASVAQVAEVHAWLDQKMQQLGYSQYQCLYGGSVKADNAQSLISVPFVDGFLVGGASLEVSSFLKIIEASF